MTQPEDKRSIKRAETLSSRIQLIEDDVTWMKVQESPRLLALANDFLARDDVANKLQHRYQRKLTYIAIGSYIFLICFELFAHLTHKNPFVLAVGIGGLALAIFVYRSGARKDQVAYLGARADSEARRIGFFWQMGRCSLNLGDTIPSLYQARLEHLAKDLNDTYNEAEALDLGHRFEREAIEREWFLSQRRYLRRAIKSHHRAALRLFYVSRVSYALAVILAIVLLGLSSAKSLHWLEVPEDLFEVFLTFCPVFLVTAALSEFLSSKRGFAAHAERYHHTRGIYPHRGNPGKWETVLERTGDEALHEVLAWYITSTEREVDLMS